MYYMNDGNPMSIRLDRKMLVRIDRVRQALIRKTGGVEITRTATIKLILEKGLEMFEPGKP